MDGARVFEGEALGSPLRLALLAPAGTAAAAWEAVTREMAGTDQALSRFRDDADLTALNLVAGTGRCSTVHRRLRVALALAWRAYRITEGAFDPRIIGVLEGTGEHSGVRLPTSPEALHAHEPWLTHARGGVGLAAPIDLGGIGKGLALRWSADALEALGIHSYLVGAGGDVVAAGRPASNALWRISVAGRDPRSRPIAVLALPAAHRVAVATSAVTRRPWHIIDPRTQRPVETALAQVSVAHRDPAWAEVRAKWALIAGSSDFTATPSWTLDRGGAWTPSEAGQSWVAWRT